MYKKDIIIFGRKVTVACDGECDKAWGINNRPCNQLSEDDDDDFEYLADDELGIAPINPGTYEGGHGKPQDEDEVLNKWCVRECERCSRFRLDEEIILKDFSKRRKNKGN